MNIKSITIENVRGIGHKEIQLNMIPNKPSILVAPNGSGKSSFALAFQRLNGQYMKLNKYDAYKNDINNRPKLIIETDEPNCNRYIADTTRNEIRKKFGIHVIKNIMKAESTGIQNRITKGVPIIKIPEIEILGKEPEQIELCDDFEEAYAMDEVSIKLFPKIDSDIKDTKLMSLLDIPSMTCTSKEMKEIVDVINRIKGYKGSTGDRRKKIEQNDLDILKAILAIKNISEFLQSQTADDELNRLLKAVRLVTYRYRHRNEIKSHIKYAKYKQKEEEIKRLFNGLKKMWKDIKPHKKGRKTVLDIGDTQKISNGERDSLLFIGMLLKARESFSSKNNILIIDEIFDYMDDANLVVAQYYINQFISTLKENDQNIYPIILTHINPSYYRTFAFKDMKVYYFNALNHPYVSNNMMRLIKRRDELEKVDKDKADLISKYMLHFHTDYTHDMTEIIKLDTTQWGNIELFKSYCDDQLKKYINGETYDALAVCVALREKIEKYCYTRLHNDEQRMKFLNEIHGTGNKIAYAEDIGVEYPETFSLLGLIYNDPLHASNKNNIDIRQTLYSRLDNLTIKSMIENISLMQ